jgi:hypothetical protein
MKELESYLERANEIIGERTKEEELYDIEVVKCLKKYGKIRKALNRANKKYPNEALKYDDSNIVDLQARYEYMVEHYEIVKRMSH